MDFPNLDNSIINSSNLFAKRADEFKQIETSKIEAGKLPLAKKAEFAKVARGFESIFINMLYKEMKSAMLGEQKEEMTFGKNTLEGYTDMQFTDYLSNSGKGMGIAELIYKQFTGEGSIPNVTQTFEKAIKNVKPIHSTQSKQNLENVNGNFYNNLNSRIENYQDIIQDASSKFGVPQELIKSVISAESAGKNDAVSHAGAKGLMQLMDGTAKDVGVKDVFDPYDNIMGGTKYLKNLLERFDGDTNLALAAYNAGPGNVDKFNGIPPFKETNAYITRVKKYLNYFESEAK